MKHAFARQRTSPRSQLRSFFKPCFTVVNNAFWDSGLAYTLPPAQYRIIMMIIRGTSGYLRHWFIAGETSACLTTHLSRAALYEAKAALVEQGYIQVDYTSQGCSSYRLAPELQSLLEDVDSAEANSFSGSSEMDSPPLLKLVQQGRKSVCPSTQLDHDKDIKENLNTHHQAPPESEIDDDAYLGFCNEDQSIDESTSRQWATNAPIQPQPAQEDFQSPEFIAEMEALCTELEKSWPTSASPKSSAAVKTPAQTVFTVLQTDLAGKLEICGVNRRIAEKLVLESAPEIIQRALAALPTRKEIAKPAGWLVQEIRSGGYAAPVAVQADSTRRQVAQARQADNIREEGRRDAEEAAGSADRARLQNLPPDQLAQLIDEALQRLPAFIRDKAREKPNEFPPLRAEMVAILRERVQQTGQNCP